MKDHLVESLKHTEKNTVLRMGARLWWIGVWSVARFLLTFQPDSTLKMMVNIVAVIAISWQLLMCGTWFGKYKIINILKKGVEDSSDDELFQNLIKIVDGRDILSEKW